MIWLLYALIFFFFLFLLIIFTKLSVHLDYYHHNDNDDLKVEFRIWFGLIKYKLKVPLIKIDDDSPSVVVKGNTKLGESSDEKHKEGQVKPEKAVDRIKEAKEIADHVIRMHVIIKKFLKRITVSQFEWHSLVGSGNAADTGVITGALWAIKGSIAGMLSHLFKMKEMPLLSVIPHFQIAIIQTRITCIFKFRIGYAILAGLKLIKFWKGGRPNLKINAAYSKEKTKSV